MLIHFGIIKKLLEHRPKLFVLDVDGCLTNAQVHYCGSNEQNVVFSVYDGEAIMKLLKLLDILVISGRSSNGVRRRCLELGIKEENIFLGVHNKSEVLKTYVENHSKLFTKQDIMAIGDQSSDLSIVPYVNIFICPRNTNNFDVLKHADYVTFTHGGESALFEVFKLLEHFFH